MKFPDYELLVFSKSPELGKVKTRLQPTYSLEFSLNLHQQLMDYCLRQWQSAELLPIELWLAGERRLFEQRLPQWQCLSIQQQQGETLGERMAYAAKQGLRDSEGVILVGTDCPFIDADYLAAACVALNNHDVVIGPAVDGGYVLLAIKRFEPRLFDNIHWGSEQVLQQTREAIKHSGLNFFELSTLPDIDRPEDIKLLQSLPGFQAWATEPE